MAAAFVVVLTTVPESLDAGAFARVLVEERLAACVNILPVMTSVYQWQGKVEDGAERQLLIKTSAARIDELRARLIALHPYDVPEFVVLEIAGGSTEYLSWIGSSVS